VIVKFDGLNFHYRKNKELILRDINLKINEGELVGIVGHNGAGKTTLMKIISGLLTPTNYQSFYISQQNRVSLILNTNQLYDNLSILENIKLNFSLNKLHFNDQNVKKLLSEMGLISKKDELVSSLSTGQKQKVNIVKALAIDSNLIILDEPTNGLDPIARFEFLKLVGEVVRKLEVTVLFCSHIISEVEKVCNRVMMLNEGEISMDLPIGEIFNIYPKNVYEVFVPKNSNFDEWLVGTDEKNYIISEILDEVHITIFTDKNIELSGDEKRCLSFQKRKATLEDIYIFQNRG